MNSSSESQRQRVLLLPVEIAGYANRVRKGFEEIGWEADVLDLTGDPFSFGAPPPRDRTLRWLTWMHRAAAACGPVALMMMGVVSLPLRMLATLSALRHKDALVYLFGRTLLFGLDVRLARLFGVRTVAVYLGSDARPPWMNGNYLNVDDGVRWRLLRWRTWLTARRVRSLERLVDVVVCHPASGQLMTQPFVSWLAVGMPVDELGSPRSSPQPTGPLRVVHAPSRRRQKGSDAIEATVADLDDTISLSFATISGVPNSIVREEIGRADLVIDELYSDTFLGGVGVEAAAAGVPVLVFGYSADFLRPATERFGLPHRHYAKPEALAKAVRRAVADPAWRALCAEELYDHVRTTLAPAAVAERLARLIRGDVPPDWLVEPAGIDYVLGFGMSREVARCGLSQYLDRFGEKALHLPPGSAALHAVRRLAAAVPDSAALP